MPSQEPTPHILVVDDHCDIREPLAKFLVKHGFRVTTAETSAAAAGSVLRAAIGASKRLMLY